MSDRYHTLTVVLEHDMRTDDAEHLIAATRRAIVRAAAEIGKGMP